MGEEEEDLAALLEVQANEIAFLRQQVIELHSRQSELRARLTAYVSKTQAVDAQAVSAFAAEVAKVKAEQESFKALQAEFANTLQTEFEGFCQEMRVQLGALRTAVEDQLRAAIASGLIRDPGAAAVEYRARVEASVAARRSVLRVDPSDPLRGLLAALGRLVGGDPVEMGAVEVSASGTLEDGRLGPQNAVAATEETAFVSQNAPGQWLRYDFKHRRVKLTHYSLRSRFNGFQGSNNPRDWVVEISDDGSTWTTVDRQSENDELNAQSVTKVFHMNPCPEARYVQLRQVGVAHSGKHFLVVSGFELFGFLHD
jgi:hypothetical protein